MIQDCAFDTGTSVDQVLVVFALVLRDYVIDKQKLCQAREDFKDVEIEGDGN